MYSHAYLSCLSLPLAVLTFLTIYGFVLYSSFLENIYGPYAMLTGSFSNIAIDDHYRFISINFDLWQNDGHYVAHFRHLA